MTGTMGSYRLYTSMYPETDFKALSIWTNNQAICKAIIGTAQSYCSSLNGWLIPVDEMTRLGCIHSSTRNLKPLRLKRGGGYKLLLYALMLDQPVVAWGTTPEAPALIRDSVQLDWASSMTNALILEQPAAAQGNTPETSAPIRYRLPLD